MLLPPNTLRSRDRSLKDVKYISFNFYSEQSYDLPILMKGAFTNEIHSLFRAFAPIYLTDSDHNSRKAAHIVGYILEVLLEANQHATQNSHIQKAIAYINMHIYEPITLLDVAKYLNLTREYTATLFKKEMGTTISIYINEKKLLLARDMIRAHEYSLGEISHILGYDNYGYFSRIFKKQFGVSPSQII